MLILDAQRLFLRPFAQSDFEAVNAYASVPENVKYMIWGPNNDEATRVFLRDCEAKWNADPVSKYEFAVVLKDGGGVIGGCGIYLNDKRNEAMIGWILHRDYWKRGLMPEAATAMLGYCFDVLKLHRVYATCNAENYGSYRVMEKAGMRREAHFVKNRFGRVNDKEVWYDEYHYAILDEEWEIRKEINYYNSLPVLFDGFAGPRELSGLTDGEITLVCFEKTPYEPEKKFVPSYTFEITDEGKRIGNISLRVGYNEGLYYGGHIGYDIDEQYRGNGYACRACRLLVPLMKTHGMTKVLISNDQDNSASKRVCEKLGARFLRTASVPEWHGLYEKGIRCVNIYEWVIG